MNSTHTHYDVIVVGARCAGSPAAMLLARMGQRVLLVDRAEFPSDTISTHLVHPPGIAALDRWGLLDRLVATGCPAITKYTYDLGPFSLTGSPLPTASGIATAFGPRRTVLDKILLDSAAEAGVEIREGFHVQDVLFEDGRVVGVRGRSGGRSGAVIEERADLVVGADGRHSKVAESVRARTYHERPTASVSYYAYWSGLPADGFEAYISPGRVVAGMPTHDDLNCLVVAAPRRELEFFRSDVERNYLKALEQVPQYADRVGAATRESRFVGMTVPNFYRHSYGPGWVLVGDAGYDRDPCTAQGISDAFGDAESLAGAWGDVRSGKGTFSAAMAHRQRVRDETTLPLYEFTCQLGSFEPPQPDQAQLLGAAARSEAASQGFVSMIAGTMPVAEFFSETNVGRILEGSS